MFGHSKSENGTRATEKQQKNNISDWDDSDYLEAPQKLRPTNDSGLQYLRICCIFTRQITFRFLFFFFFFSIFGCWLTLAEWMCAGFEYTHAILYHASFPFFRCCRSVYQRKPSSQTEKGERKKKKENNIKFCHRRCHTPANQYIIYFLVFRCFPSMPMPEPPYFILFFLIHFLRSKFLSFPSSFD